jgi:hypothetical protein
MRIAPFWVITQRVVVNSLPTFRDNLSGSTFKGHESYIQGSKIWYTWSLKMGPIGCPETSVRNYRHSLHNNPEEQSSPPGQSSSLKVRNLLRSSWQANIFDAKGWSSSVTLKAYETPEILPHILWFRDVHDHPLYLVCPDMLCAIGETSYGKRVRFIESTHSPHYLFMHSFVFGI